ncbi:MAG: hypothetical protein M3457_11860 [Chloroflexota bacterium]|nr:hypothetical protein [Chloroflexota bacterium]
MDECRCSCDSERTMAVATARAVDGVLDLLRHQVRRPEAAAPQVTDDLRGLLAAIDRKHGWHLAEHAGDAHPRGIQRVLDR